MECANFRIRIFQNSEFRIWIRIIRIQNSEFIFSEFRIRIHNFQDRHFGLRFSDLRIRDRILQNRNLDSQCPESWFQNPACRNAKSWFSQFRIQNAKSSFKLDLKYCNLQNSEFWKSFLIQILKIRIPKVSVPESE